MRPRAAIEPPAWRWRRRLLGLLVIVASPATLATAPATAPGSTPGFSAEGLNFETELTAIYLGDFEHSRLQRLSAEFTTLYGRYIETFARQCTTFLPSNRVPITKRQCVKEQYQTNGYGVRIGVSQCIEYADIPTGLYADPVLYQAQKDLAQQYEAEVMKYTLSGGMVAAAAAAIDADRALGSDIETLLASNRCDGPGTRRFQDNLLRLATGQSAMRLPGEPGVASVLARFAAPVGATDASVGRLLADLVSDNAQGWLANRYVAGSVDEVRVKQRDAQGRPKLAQGYYLYEGQGGRKVGTVRLDFVDGMPACLYFADATSTCRHPSRRVITAYEKGRYEDRP